MQCDLMQLNAAADFQRPFRGMGTVFGLQAHPQHAVEDQGEEADQGMGTNVVGEAMEHRGDFNLAFQHPEATLDDRPRLMDKEPGRMAPLAVMVKRTVRQETCGGIMVAIDHHEAIHAGHHFEEHP